MAKRSPSLIRGEEFCDSSKHIEMIFPQTSSRDDAWKARMTARYSSPPIASMDGLIRVSTKAVGAERCKAKHFACGVLDECRSAFARTHFLTELDPELRD